jgi:hypothetical protein
MAAVLRQHMPCERGCTVELGPDVPAYVSAPNQTLHQYCLITQARPQHVPPGTKPATLALTKH